MSSTRFWLIRHAPVRNPEKLVYGAADIDVDLDDAAAIAALAAGLPKGARWWTSDLSRTVRTAGALRAATPGRTRGPDAVAVPDLREQSLGDWQGRPSAEVYRSELRLTPAVERPPGGESFIDLMARVHPVLLGLAADHGGEQHVIVAHGGTIRAALALALDLSPERALSFQIDTLSLTRIDHIMGRGWRVSLVNG